MSPDDGQLEDSVRTGVKRSRVQIRTACTKCRQRRVKCSGVVPCARCQEVGASDSCAIPSPTKRATSSRIRELELQVQQLRAALEAGRREPQTLPAASTSFHPAPSQRAQRALFLAESDAPPASRQLAGEAWSDDDLFHVEEPQSLLPRDGVSLFPNDRSPPVTYLGSERTRQILQLYADQTQPLHPVLDWPTFLEEYHKQEASLPFANDRVWLATLQVVIASALQSMSATIQIETPPVTFFAESLNILGLSTIMSTTTPALVQCLLLMTAFSQTLNEPDLSISLLGLAIQKSKALGFNSASPHVSHGRLARLCWSGCISRDFYVTVALGKTPFLGEVDCRPDLLPLTSEEQAALRFPNALPHPLSFFNEGIKLHHIVYCALHRLYHRVGSPELEVSLLHELDRRLLAWHDELPSFLLPEREGLSLREASYIQIRFWYARNLVHRSALCHLLSPGVLSSTRGLTLDMLGHSAKLAVEAGLELIKRLCPVMAGTTTAWWINLISLYSACLTLILAMKLDSKRALTLEIASSRSDSAVHDALNAFKRFAHLAGTDLPAASRTSEDCATDVSRLLSKVRPVVVANAQLTSPAAMVPQAQAEPWYFANYDWSNLFTNPPLEPAIQPDNPSFDISQLLLNPGMPAPSDENGNFYDWLSM